MCSLFQSPKRYTKSTGFTLLELLVVISLLAVLAGFSITAYDGVKDDAYYDAAIFEMAEIRNALLQFRRDSGTNDFPGQGIYNCSNLADTVISATRPSSWSSDIVTPTSITKTAWVNWCAHPANFWMLFQDPLGSGWDRDSKRGWNGPYLRRKSGFVDVGSNLSSDGTGDPLSGSVILDLWGVASPFTSPPLGNYLVWRNQLSGDEIDSLGTPYLLFDLDDDGSNPTSTDPARLVSLGSDHDYDGGNQSDCMPPIDPSDNTAVNEDGLPHDHVLCLLR